MKNSQFILAILVISAVIGWKYYQRTQVKTSPEAQKYSYLSCIGTPYDLRAKVEGHLILLKKALPEGPEKQKALFEQAIYYQNFYTFTNLKDNNPHVPLNSSNMSLENSKVEILKTEDTAYPVYADFEPDVEMDGFPPEAKAYLERLLPTGKVEKGEPAVKVSYTFEVNEFLCLGEEKLSLLKDIKHVQPVDPYLAYFVVPKVQRKLIANPGRGIAYQINPCLDPAYVDDGGVSPFGLWYYWRPFAQGHDQNKEPFDCSLFYKEGVTVNTVNVTFQENPPKEVSSFDFSKLNELQRPIRTTLLMGANYNNNLMKFDVADAKRLVELYTGQISIQEAKANLPYQKYDPAFTSLLSVAWKIVQHLNVIRKEIKVDENSVEVVLQGKLKLSKKDMELKLFLSPNNHRLPGYEKFSRFVADNFLTNDVLIYVGHSASGTAFDGAFELLKEEKKTSDLSYQVLGLFSCSSEMNYNAKFFPRPEGQHFKRDIIQTASTYQDVEVKAFVGLVASMDSYLYNESYVPFESWSKSFKSDNLYILSNN